MHYTRWRRYGSVHWLPPVRSELTRFMEKFEIQPDGCWLWTAGAHPQGYGRFSVARRTVRAHRWILEQHLERPLRPGYHACHRCDRPSCVNPDHLFEGSAQENVDDMIRKDRRRFISGAAVATAKLSVVLAEAIRADYAAGGLSQRALGVRYGVSQSQVSDVVTGKRWRTAA